MTACRGVQATLEEGLADAIKEAETQISESAVFLINMRQDLAAATVYIQGMQQLPSSSNDMASVDTTPPTTPADTVAPFPQHNVTRTTSIERAPKGPTGSPQSPTKGRSLNFEDAASSYREAVTADTPAADSQTAMSSSQTLQAR